MQQPDLEVQQMPTDALVPYAGNAKEHPAEQVGQIAASIDQFGFNDPVGIWHDAQGRPIIVEGHGRVLAAKELGIEQVPVVTLDHLDDEGRRAYTLAHNQLNQATPLDEEIVAETLRNIPNVDLSAFDLGEAPIEEPPSIEEIEAPEIMSLPFCMSAEQYEIVRAAIEATPDEECRDAGGGRTGNAVYEILCRWEDAREG